MDFVKELQRLAKKRAAVTIQTIDNPGWMVTIAPRIELKDKLRVEGDPPRPSNGNVGGPTWMICKVERGAFIGTGDPARLGDILLCFDEWLAEQQPHLRS